MVLSKYVVYERIQFKWQLPQDFWCCYAKRNAGSLYQRYLIGKLLCVPTNVDSKTHSIKRSASTLRRASLNRTLAHHMLRRPPVTVLFLTHQYSVLVWNKQLGTVPAIERDKISGLVDNILDKGWMRLSKLPQPEEIDVRCQYFTSIQQSKLAWALVVKLRINRADAFVSSLARVLQA